MAAGEADFVTEAGPAPGDDWSARSVWAVILVVAVGHLSLFPKTADLDAFYHIGHAAAYLEGSLFDTSLPWATRSIIGDIGGDLWWGFHVLLLPFAALGDVSAGLRLASLSLTLLLGLSFFWVLRRHEVRYPGVWAALFLLAAPNVFFRHLMLRPHVISLATSIAMVSCMVKGRWWQVALLSALISWVHLSLFWVPTGLAVAYAVSRIPVTVLLGREKPDTGVSIRYAIPAAVVGTALGWLLRPDPFAAAALLNTQLVQLFAQKAAGAPLTFATELSPIGATEIARTTWLFAGAWLIGLLVVAERSVQGRLSQLGQSRVTLMVVSILVSTAFLFLALISARRAMEQWIAFGFLILPFLWQTSGDVKQGWRLRAVAVVVLVHLGWGAYRHSLNVDLVAFPGDALQEASSYLAENSDPGDVVFHARWDNFGPLFAHNRVNRYLGGMDPIFQYAHDDQAFWEFFYLSTDATSDWTCDAYPCLEGVATDTHEALADHFGARWVLVEPRRNPRFTLYLLNDERYRLALETQREAVFEVLPIDASGRP